MTTVAPANTSNTNPVSVTSLGFLHELAPSELHDYPSEGDFRWYYLPSKYVSEISGEPWTLDCLLIAFNGSLAHIIANGFSGFVTYENDNIGQFIFRFANRFNAFPKPTKSEIESWLRSGSIPVVFADKDMEAFLVRYPVEEKWCRMLLDRESAE